MNPYSSLDYARTCDHLGSAVVLPRAGGVLLRRPVSAAPGLTDAAGPYPLMACSDWTRLPDDLEQLIDVVSVTAVVDPLARAGTDVLEAAFPDLLAPYKEHFCCEVDGNSPLRHVDRNHLKKAKRAVDALVIEVYPQPVSSHAASEWAALYGLLAGRHTLSDASRFSALSLTKQLSLPGSWLVLARESGSVVAGSVWFVDDSQAYYHLGASSPRGYELAASFGVFAVALEHLAASGVEVVDLGGTADEEVSGGLARFKRGWSTRAVQCYLGGRVVDAVTYRRLAAENPTGRQYFPAYRA